MTQDTANELKHTYDLATMRKNARTLRKPEDWQAAREIMERTKREASRLDHRYRAEYDTRVSEAVKKLMNEAGEVKRTLTHPWFTTNNFDQEAMMKQAHRNVQQDHQAQLNGLGQLEHSELESLMHTIHQRDGLRDKTGRDFEHAAERRSTEERRQGRTRNRQR